MNADIATAAERCRAAWAAAPEAKLAWCCHHAIELEYLTEPAENRIAYILAEKPEGERIARLDNFRPVLSPLPAELTKARADLSKSRAEWDKAYADWDKASAAWDKTKARAAWDKAYADWVKASAAWDKTEADWNKASAAWDKTEAHLADVPHHTWNGTDIFEKGQP